MLRVGLAARNAIAKVPAVFGVAVRGVTIRGIKDNGFTDYGCTRRAKNGERRRDIDVSVTGRR